MSDGDGGSLSVRNLHTHFFTKAGVARAVDGVDFDVAPGEILGLVGESGLGQDRHRLFHPGPDRSAGPHRRGSSIRFDGEELTTAAPERLRAIRGAEIAMIFQDPMMTLNPVLRIDTQMIETVQAHLKVSESRGARPRPRRARARSASPRPTSACAPIRTSSPAACASAWRSPSRCCTSRRLIVADEPTTALDVTIQAPDPVRDAAALPRERHGADLDHPRPRAWWRGLADRIAVMYAGRIVEMGRTADIIERPMHPTPRA